MVCNCFFTNVITRIEYNICTNKYLVYYTEPDNNNGTMMEEVNENTFKELLAVYNSYANLQDLTIVQTTACVVTFSRPAIVAAPAPVQGATSKGMSFVNYYGYPVTVRMYDSANNPTDTVIPASGSAVVTNIVAGSHFTIITGGTYDVYYLSTFHTSGTLDVVVSYLSESANTNNPFSAVINGTTYDYYTPTNYIRLGQSIH